MYFAAQPPQSYAEVMACDREAFNRFFHAMLREGVYLAPSAFEAGFVSAAHTEADIEQTVSVRRAGCSREIRRLARLLSSWRGSPQPGDVLRHRSHLLVGQAAGDGAHHAWESLARSPAAERLQLGQRVIDVLTGQSRILRRNACAVG